MAGLIFRAAAPFHWAGKVYETDDSIDSTGWSDEAIRTFTKRCPVYVDQSGTAGTGGTGGPETDPIATGQVTTERTRALAAESANTSALNSHEIATPAHSAAGVSFSPTGLAVVTGTTVQAALAQLDAAVGRPTTPAGGALSGSYPNPDLASNYITDTYVAPGAAIAESKLALASDAAPSVPSRRVSQARSPVGWWRGSAYGGVIASNQALINGYAFLDPIFVTEAETWDQVATRTGVTAMVGGSGVFVDFAVYADNGHGGATGAPLATAMAVPVPTVANADVVGTLSSHLAVTPGLYHVAVGYRYTTAPTTAASFAVYGSGIPPNYTNFSSAATLINPGYGYWNYNGSFGTSPALSTTGAWRNAACVHVLSRP